MREYDEKNTRMPPVTQEHISAIVCPKSAITILLSL